MSSFLKAYGDTEGPLGYPMKDADARALDQLLSQYPEHEYQRTVVEKATTELSPGERADVSWIQTECPDRLRDVVLTSGFDDTFFKSNPIVTLNHNYSIEPVGRSLWRRKVRDGATYGIKAKTVYPVKAEEWSAERPWPPDSAFALVKAGLMSGKSIGFILLKARTPTDEEVVKKPEWKGVWRIVEKWALVEYSCCYLPVNPECTLEAVSKALVTSQDFTALGMEPPRQKVSQEPIVKAFTPWEEVEKAIARSVQEFDFRSMAQNAIDKARGKV